MCSPELGTVAGTWRASAAALFRFDTLPLHADAWEVINKTSFQRRTDYTHPHAHGIEERQSHHLRFIRDRFADTDGFQVSPQMILLL